MTGQPELEDAWPLSPLQEGMLFHALFDEHALDVYTVRVMFDIEGPLDSARLRIAAQKLLDRNSCLRVALVPANDPPVQVVVREVPVPWREVDLSDWSFENQASRLGRLVEDDRKTRFDLQTPPLLRFLLVKTGEVHHRLMLSTHHILLDGWSMSLMMGELFALYASGGDGSALPKARSFRDHLMWLSTRNRSAASAAWAQALQGIEEPTLLAGADRTRPPGISQRVDAAISEDLTSQLTSFARAQGLTMNTLVWVAWAVVLSRSIGRSDVVFGATVAGRPAELAGVESMLGLFINTIPVRVQLDPMESLVDLLHRIQIEQYQLLDHQYLGLAEIQRDTGADVLFDTLVVFDSSPFDVIGITRTLKNCGITLTGIQWDDSTHYPISLMAILGTRLQITLSYQPDFFDPPAVSALTDRLVRVLEAVVVNPRGQVGEVSAFSTRERDQLFAERHHHTRGLVRRPRRAATDKIKSGEPEILLERALCELFAEVLGLDQVGVNDSFFELGGYSLTAIRLISRIKSKLGSRLSIRTLFESPTVAGLIQRLDMASHVPLVSVTRPEIIPLSFAQQRMWFFYQLDGPSSKYNFPYATRLRGKLDISALEVALGDVVERHETLRTVFPDDAGVPRQQVLPADLTRPGIPVTEIEEEQLADELDRAAGYKFLLDREPPIRARLFRLASNDHVLFLLLHHIAGDEWSTAVLLQDLSVAYAARSSAGAPSWNPLPVQYIDYTFWQRETLGKETDPDSVISTQARFWVEKLAGAPEELTLPWDRPRRPVPSHRGGSVSFSLPTELSRHLRALARECGASEFMGVEVAVAVVLSKIGAGQDILIGTPIAGRNDDALNELVGFFVNTLVLRNDLSGNPTFRELLSRVRDTALAAYAHQDIPFELLVEILNPKRSPSRHPLFQTIVVHQNQPPAMLSLPGMDVTQVSGEPKTARFDLAFWFVDQGKDSGIEGSVRYHTDVFDRISVELICARLVRVLQAMVTDPDSHVTEVEVLTVDERHKLIVEWNDTATEIPAMTLLELFEQQVARTPNATAVVCEGTSLTYAELDAQAAQLGCVLAELKIGPEQLVGIHVERSADLIIALVGVLKAGAAFVPLEPTWPARRINEVCRMSGLAAVVTDDPGAFPAVAGVPVVGIADVVSIADKEKSSSRIAGATDGYSCVTPEGLAYVVFTSGSTGTPKGAMIRHGAIAARLCWQRELLGLGTGDAVLFKALLSFDISINEVFLPLVSGARLVVAEPGGERDVEYLLEVIEREQVTFVYLVSSMLDMLLELPDVGARARGLRHVWCGGEALGAGLFDRFQASLDAIMHHGYGPAEATIGVTYQCYHPSQTRDGVTIGRPNPNTQIYLLEEGLRPVPVGVTGELYVGGSPLGRGYVNDPVQTASRFVADPFHAGGRLYRTGDLACWRSNGVLEFRGRADNQIKIRGMRVELEEIEAVLGQHPQVRQAVVRTDTSPTGTTRLLGYCTTTCEHLDPAQLHAWTADRLPEHMVPAIFVILDTIPLTPNGKINRQALPAPGVDHEPGYTDFLPPQGAEEVAVAQVWAEVLGLDRVGRHDNFFELGGDSLLGARMVLRLRAVLQCQIPLRELFRHQTVSGLASVLASPQRTSSAAAQPGRLPVSDARGQQSQVLPPWPEILPPLTPRCGGNVLLTGASGFFGAFLLREILTRYRGTVHCLIRANGTTQAWNKLHANLRRYGLSEGVPQNRIRVVVGDLARPRLDLGDDEYERLAEEVDLIIHNGARVDMLHTYETIEAANVNGTRELLQLAATTWRKPLRFVSTSSAAGYRPSDPGEGSGYLESKWRAEQIVAEARAYGIPAAVYRVPRLSPDSRTGRGNDRDLIFRTIRWILDLGVAPDDVPLTEDWVPVDEAARLLIDPYPGPEHGGAFVVTAQREMCLTEIIELARRIGHEIEYKPALEWVRELASRSVEDYEVLVSVLHIDSAGDAPAASIPVPRDGASRDGFVPIVARGVTEQILLRYLHVMSPAHRTG